MPTEGEFWKRGKFWILLSSIRQMVLRDQYPGVEKALETEMSYSVSVLLCPDRVTLRLSFSIFKIWQNASPLELLCVFVVSLILTFLFFVLCVFHVMLSGPIQFSVPLPSPSALAASPLPDKIRFKRKERKDKRKKKKKDYPCHGSCGVTLWVTQ